MKLRGRIKGFVVVVMILLVNLHISRSLLLVIDALTKLSDQVMSGRKQTNC